MDVVMKNRHLIIGCLLLLVGLTGSMNAQPVMDTLHRGSELRIGYGNFPQNTFNDEFGFGNWSQMSGIYEYTWLTPLSPLVYSSHAVGDLTSYGSFHLSYLYKFRSRWQFSVNGSYAGAHAPVYAKIDGERLGRVNISFTAVYPSMQYFWINRPAFQLYSGLGVGLGFLRYSMVDDVLDKEVSTIVQLAPLGLTLGRDWYGFAEWNIGWNNYIKIGVGYRF